MKAFRLSVRFPGGSPLVGGYSAVPSGLHGAHAQDADGRPLIPATALRGALRETLEGLLRGAGEGACRGGDGHDAQPSENAAQAIPCKLDRSSGQRCKACQLFGTQRAMLDPQERAFSGLVLGAATLPAAIEPQWTLRPGVAISRARRSAEDQRLFLRRVPMLGHTALVATGRLLDDKLKPLFEAAVHHTTHLGAGRSRGLARVELGLEWQDLPTVSPESFPVDGDVLIRVTLESPAIVGAAIVNGNYRGCRSEIPGSALRGAVGFALAEAAVDTSEQAFQSLFATDGAKFGFLYPAPSTPQPIVGPLPITTLACKREGDKHGVADSLLDRLALRYVEEAELSGSTPAAKAARVQTTSLTTCTCGAALRSWTAFRGNAAHPSVRTVTRVAMDRARGAARDQMLFTQEMLEAGASFEGLIRDIPRPARERLRQALAAPLSLGRGRSAGSGSVRVEVGSPVSPESLERRGEQFSEALAERLKSAGLLTESVHHLVPITLLTPLVPAEPSQTEDGEQEIGAALSATRCFLRARRFTREGGWNQLTGQMQAAQATAAGSLFVFDVGRDWREIVPILRALERQGVGERRNQGFGQLVCFDPFILSRTLTRQTMIAPDPVTSKRKSLVLAAEELMSALFVPTRTTQRKLKKTQLSSLVSICNEASCKEEIENYIRYQAGRSDKTGWDLALAKNCIDKIAPILTGMSDAEALDAWRLYAVYLARAFTYEDAKTPKGHRP